MKLPLFPLQSIFFPGETVPLHIFEPRYIQLINDCKDEAITFGIPVYINGNLDYGVEVQLVEIVSSYEEGEMDVICVARQVFKIESFEPVLEGKLYSGGDVRLLEYDYEVAMGYKKIILGKIEVLYRLMQVAFPPIDFEVFTSFTLAHKMGLSFEQEYQLLQMPLEMARLGFLDNHLITTIATLKEVERTRKAIALNGHFKNFDPLDFENLAAE